MAHLVAFICLILAAVALAQVTPAANVPSQQNPPVKTDSDSYYFWEMRSFSRPSDLDFTGMTPTYHFNHSVEEVKLPFTFTFYGRPQGTIFVDPSGFIFPHRVSVANCPSAACRRAQQQTSYIAPYMVLQGARGVDVRVFVHKDAVHVLWSYLRGDSCQGKVSSTCHLVEFSATLYPNGEIIFSYFHLPPVSKGSTPSVGLKDSVVEGGYGRMRDGARITKDVLSVIELNKQNWLFTAPRPVSVHFYPERRPVQAQAAAANQSLVGVRISEDCHNVSTEEECNHLSRHLFCFWCAPAHGHNFNAFCGRAEDQDPNADIIFSNACRPVKARLQPASASDDDSQQQQQHQDDHAQQPFTNHLLGSDMYTVTQSADRFQSLPRHSSYSLHSRYYGRVSQRIDLPFDMPFYQHKISSLTLSFAGLLYVDARECRGCHDILHMSPLLNSHIAPLTGMWSFHRTFAPPTEHSALSRYDAHDNSFVHFEWSNARMVHPVFDCPDLHCQRCYCPIHHLPPFTFSATLYRNGTIAFNYPHYTQAFNNIDLETPDLGKISVGDTLTAVRNPVPNAKPIVLHYQSIDGTALQEQSQDDLLSILMVPRPNAQSCNNASDHPTCQARSSSSHPCMWCHASSRYTGRRGASFCSAGNQNAPLEVNNTALTCRYLRGPGSVGKEIQIGASNDKSPPAPNSGESSMSSEAIAGAIGAIACLIILAVAVFVIFRRRKTGSTPLTHTLSLSSRSMQPLD